MSDWRTDAPDWPDEGLIEIRLSGGKVVLGGLTIGEHWTGVDDAEVYLVDGTRYDLGSAEAWRPHKP